MKATTDAFFAFVKNLSSGPLSDPQVTFNKRLEGYRMVPSAAPYHCHRLYSGAW